MKKPNIKFVATDMDGTLLDENSRLCNSFYDVHQQLEDNNIIFAAASGRQYYSLLRTFAPIKDRMMFIAENGTMVMHQGKELYSCGIDTPSIKEIIKLARSIEGTHIVLCGKQSAYIETHDVHAIEEIAKYYHRCEQVEDLLEVEDEFIKVAILNFDGSEELIYPTIYKQFGESHQVVVSAKIWLDVMNAEASKGAALRHLQQTLGFTKEQTMVFGDYLNDLEMLKEAYYSYAMDNAHPKVKEVARFSAPSNQEQGVIKVLKEYIES